MKSLKIIFVLIISVHLLRPQKSIAQTFEPNTYKLYVQLINAPFDSLYLHDYTEGKNILYSGKKIKDFTWEITLPSKDISNSENMMLLASPSGPNNKTQKMVRFITEKKNIVVNVGVEDEYSYIYGDFLESNLYPKEGAVIKINKTDSTIIGDLLCLDFKLIVKDVNSDISVRSQDPVFSLFIDLDEEKMNYDSILNSYIEHAKKYSDSRFLMSSLSRMLSRYKSKSDVKKVYENLSQKYKKTFWADRIEMFLNNSKFINRTLPTDRENTNEYIIQNESKYNLIIFSASWCLPCIEEIPLLKQVYKDIGKDLILTFISLDDAKGIAPYKDLMLRNNIPWRTLFAYPDIEKIKQQYFIEGIPHSILVYPNQDMEVIDVRREKERNKLYAYLKVNEKIE
jgi:thiol-disulfide isomerase/thioredoxin